MSWDGSWGGGEGLGSEPEESQGGGLFASILEGVDNFLQSFGYPSELDELEIDPGELPFPEAVGTPKPKEYSAWCRWAHELNSNTAFQMYQLHPEWGEWPGSVGKIPWRIWCKIPTT